MNVLAWFIIAGLALELLPGTSAFKDKPEIAWEKPWVYVKLAVTFAVLALAIWVLA